MAAPAHRTVLILGGTAEAMAFAESLAARPEVKVITSLAGRTKVPRRPPGDVRIGGFSGVEGLARFLEENAVDALVDATHPFATRISANAVAASRLAGVPLLVIARPAWVRQPEDHWIEVANESEAAAALPARARALLAIGSQHLGAFRARDDVTYLVRMIDEPRQGPPLDRCTIILGRPSRSVAAERALLQAHRVSHLVCRNSGGDASYAKVAAARDLALPVIMIIQPMAAGGATAVTIDEARAWLDRVLIRRNDRG